MENENKATYTEICGDIFKSEYIGNPNTCILHCVSSDYALGAGIAIQIEKRYNVRQALISLGKYTYPDCIRIGNILNMVTKQYYYNKPTYENFVTALTMVKDQCLLRGINHLIMPKIGCGLDKLNWETVRAYIQDILVSSGISCTVYEL